MLFVCLSVCHSRKSLLCNVDSSVPKVQRTGHTNYICCAYEKRRENDIKVIVLSSFNVH